MAALAAAGDPIALICSIIQEAAQPGQEGAKTGDKD